MCRKIFGILDYLSYTYYTKPLNMISQTKKTVYRFLLGALLLSFVVVACNNKGKEKKEEAPADTTKTEVAPPPPPVDTTKMDTVDTRPVKPAD